MSEADISSTYMLIFMTIAILLTLAVPVITIYKENSDKRATRGEFFIAALLYFIGNAFANIIADQTGKGLSENIIGLVLVVVLILALTWHLFTKLVQRARDAGYSKTICYVSVIPIVNLFTGLFLLFAPTKNPDDPQTSEGNPSPPPPSPSTETTQRSNVPEIKKDS